MRERRQLRDREQVAAPAECAQRELALRAEDAAAAQADPALVGGEREVGTPARIRRALARRRRCSRAVAGRTTTCTSASSSLPRSASWPSTSRNGSGPLSGPSGNHSGPDRTSSLATRAGVLALLV